MQSSVYMSQVNAKNIAGLLQDIANLRQEHFILFSLDSAGEIINRRTLFIGTLTSVITHPREIFASAITDGAYRLVVAHNHPSGTVQPTDGDITTTNQLYAGGLILGIQLYDHIIVGHDGYFSFREQGYLELELFEERGMKHDRLTC